MIAMVAPLTDCVTVTTMLLVMIEVEAAVLACGLVVVTAFALAVVAHLERGANRAA